MAFNSPSLLARGSGCKLRGISLLYGGGIVSVFFIPLRNSRCSSPLLKGTVFMLLFLTLPLCLQGGVAVS